MDKAVKITREEANTIIDEHLRFNRDYAQVVVCWKAQWWDMRALNQKERWDFIQSLIGPVSEKEVANINITL